MRSVAAFAAPNQQKSLGFLFVCILFRVKILQIKIQREHRSARLSTNIRRRILHAKSLVWEKFLSENGNQCSVRSTCQRLCSRHVGTYSYIGRMFSNWVCRFCCLFWMTSSYISHVRIYGSNSGWISDTDRFPRILGQSSMPPFFQAILCNAPISIVPAGDGHYLIPHSAAFSWNCMPACQPRAVAYTLRDDLQRHA